MQYRIENQTASSLKLPPDHSGRFFLQLLPTALVGARPRSVPISAAANVSKKAESFRRSRTASMYCLPVFSRAMSKFDLRMLDHPDDPFTLPFLRRTLLSNHLPLPNRSHCTFSNSSFFTRAIFGIWSDQRRSLHCLAPSIRLLFSGTSPTRSPSALNDKTRPHGLFLSALPAQAPITSLSFDQGLYYHSQRALSLPTEDTINVLNIASPFQLSPHHLLQPQHFFLTPNSSSSASLSSLLLLVNADLKK